jgi:hypothetical protein
MWTPRSNLLAATIPSPEALNDGDMLSRNVQTQRDPHSSLKARLSIDASTIDARPPGCSGLHPNENAGKICQAL